MRLNRWSKQDVLERVWAALELDRELATASLDSTIIKLHPDGARAPKKGRQAIGRSHGGWMTKLHLLARDDRGALALALSPGQAADAAAGWELLERHGPRGVGPALLMDRAYEDSATRALALALGWRPVVPPKRNRRQPWDYDRELYKRRNQVERLFRRLKRFRRIATRYDKLDAVFLAFIHLTLIFDALPVA